MDVKDIKGLLAVPDPDLGAPTGNSKTNGQTSARSVSSGTSAPAETGPVTILLETKPSDSDSNSSRDKANQAIVAINLAAEATNDIENLVSSVGGILEQVSKDEISAQRRGVLEKEANDLVSEIKKKAAVESPDGVRPLFGDQIRLEIEAHLGKSLDLILPDEAKNAFGIGTIKFSAKDSIIDTVVSVAEAKARIESLKKSLDDSRDKVIKAVNAVDVAAQNSEAAKASVRDVDAALELASDTRGKISSNPEQAIGSLGSLSQKVIDLLRS